jgi:anti-anti-sigma factor
MGRMDRFAVGVREAGPGRSVVAVSGELDLATAGQLWAELEPLIKRDALVVLDGTAMTFLDSSGLRVLLLAGKRAAEGGTAFRLVAPQAAVQRVLDLSGAIGHIETRNDIPGALES